MLITGGAGFVGTNLADRLLRDGRDVILLDSLRREGTQDNVAWLRRTHGERARLKQADLRDESALQECVDEAGAVFHLAAQVAVTTSLEDPSDDFEVNAQGTFRLLEALRARDAPIPLVFASTNKVYGGMEDVRVVSRGSRCAPEPKDLDKHGVDERRPLDFHSPYGCSKGAADQYVIDYGRIYGLPNVVLRMSCTYGPHQHGNEDQGWVAHFLLATLRGEPITIFGDGRQVRDVLFVDDLVDAFLTAEREAPRLKARAFNVGGGPSNTLSLLELVEKIPELTGRKPDVRFADARPGDQPWYVSDTRAFESATGWRARVGVDEGLERLAQWLKAEKGTANHQADPPVPSLRRRA